MSPTLTNLPLGSLIFYFVVLPSLASAGIAMFVRRVLPLEFLSANNDLAAITYPVVGLIYGVFLAFAIVIVWQRFTDAERSTYDEVAALGSMWRDASAFPAEQQQVLHDRLREYVDAVQTQEWPRMTTSRADTINDDAYDRLWKTYAMLTPKTENEKTFYGSSIDALNSAGRYRRARLLYSGSEMPGVLWAFLIFGAFVTVVCSYFIGTRSVFTHVLMCGAITSLVCFSLVLIVSLSRPFAGDVHVSSDSYADLLKSFSR